MKRLLGRMFGIVESGYQFFSQHVRVAIFLILVVIAVELGVVIRRMEETFEKITFASFQLELIGDDISHLPVFDVEKFKTLSPEAQKEYRRSVLSRKLHVWVDGGSVDVSGSSVDVSGSVEIER